MGRDDDGPSYGGGIQVFRPNPPPGEDGHRCDSQASTPHLRPARPIASPSDASTGTSSSQIHEVPHSEIQRLPRNRKATIAAGRVSRPMTSRTPRESSGRPRLGAPFAGGVAPSP